jgi:hypothetical protein
VPIVLKSGSLNLLEPSGPVKACNGIALPFTFKGSIKEKNKYIGRKGKDRECGGNLVSFLATFQLLLFPQQITNNTKASYFSLINFVWRKVKRCYPSRREFEVIIFGTVLEYLRSIM